MPRLGTSLWYRLEPTPSAPSPMQRELGNELRGAQSIKGRDQREGPQGQTLHTVKGLQEGSWQDQRQARLTFCCPQHDSQLSRDF